MKNPPFRPGRFEKLNDYERARGCARCSFTGWIYFQLLSYWEPEPRPCTNCQGWLFESIYRGLSTGKWEISEPPPPLAETYLLKGFNQKPRQNPASKIK